MVEHPVCAQHRAQLRERDRAAPLNSIHRRRLPERLFSAAESPLVLPLPMFGELVPIGTLLAFVIVCAGALMLRYTDPELRAASRSSSVTDVGTRCSSPTPRRGSSGC
jgi:hypothetical protein